MFVFVQAPGNQNRPLCTLVAQEEDAFTGVDRAVSKDFALVAVKPDVKRGGCGGERSLTIRDPRDWGGLGSL